MTDLNRFLALVKSLPRAADPALRGLFTPEAPVAIARAPGRLDVMGGIADYSGSLVLELPLGEATLAAAQQSDDRRLRIVSLSEGSPARCVDLGSEDLQWLRGCFTTSTPSPPAPLPQGERGVVYDAARQHFHRHPDIAWAAYVAGVLLVLAREQGIVASGGLRILVRSDVPEGKGVSSSAALEVAVMQAVTGLLGRTLDGMELARLCQIAENHVVGAPCGIMDQMTSALGRADHLLALLCQPAAVQGFVRLPEAVGVWGVDSGIRHAVSGSDYTSVRTGAFMGYRILADLAGLAATEGDAAGVVRIEDPLWKGYLANVTPDEFQSRLAARLPEKMRGDEFLRRYGGTTDRVTRVQPERVYAVRQPTAHPIHENAGVRRFAELLPSAGDESARREMGELMYASHASYSACGLGSEGTDRLVELVRQAGPAAGLYGAKITGGGSGGTVAVLGRSDSGPAIAELARDYAQETGRGGYLFSGSSGGACQAGVQIVEIT